MGLHQVKYTECLENKEEGVVKGRRSSKYFRDKNKLMTDTEKPSKGFPSGYFHYYRRKSQFTDYFFRKKARCFH